MWQLLHSDVGLVVVDLTAAIQCDRRLVGVLDQARRRLEERDGTLRVWELVGESLTGFETARLPDVLALYRASRATAGASAGARQASIGGMPRRYGELERQVAQACVGLLEAVGGDGDVAGLTTRLTALCVGRLGADEAAVSLPAHDDVAAVVSASSQRARQVARFGLTAGQGPVADCLAEGRPVAATENAEMLTRWPRFARRAIEHDIGAVWVLPLRRHGRTIGALSLFADTPGPMAPADLAVAQAWADLTATGILVAQVLGEHHGPSVGASSAGVDRVIVEQAVGILVYSQRLTVAAARVRLRRRARGEHRRLVDIAHDIVEDSITREDSIPGPDRQPATPHHESPPAPAPPPLNTTSGRTG